MLERHVLRAGLIPVITMMGMQFAAMMGGAIVVENIFAWNGVGRLAIEAIFQRDYPMIQGFILVFATVVVAVSILLDVGLCARRSAHPQELTLDASSSEADAGRKQAREIRRARFWRRLRRVSGRR